MLPEVKKNSEFQFYIKTICSNVARCNSILKQVSLYNELGLKLIEINHNHYLDDFISKYIEIFNISEDNFSILSEILKDSGTLLYLKMKIITLSYLRSWIIEKLKKTVY